MVVSDTMMFQRGEPEPSDEHLGSFYGLALPLLKRGMPVEPVQLENADDPGHLDRYKVLLMTYEGMKPMTPEVHQALAAWVKAGGASSSSTTTATLTTASAPGGTTEPKGMAYRAPREHLFEQLGLARDARARRPPVGKGS